MIQFVPKLLPCLTIAVPLAIAAHPTIATAQPTPAQPATGCLSGTPNGTYRGDRPLTRNEFTAEMNTCLNQVNERLEFNKANFATRTDFETLIQRQRELNEQLKELSDRLAKDSE